MRGLTKAYTAALVVTSLMLPGLAATLTMILFLIGGRRQAVAGADKYSWIDSSGTRSWIFGTLIAFVLWAVLAAFFRRYAYVDRANPSEYEKLLQGYETLRARLDAAGPEAASPALAVGKVHLDEVGRALGVLDTPPEPGWRWAAAVGYVGLHERLHRAEEAMLDLEDVDEIRADVNFDISRLSGSRIADSRDLVKRLEGMLLQLDTGADVALGGVRAGLRRIRRTVNEFRDSRRAGLVRARNNLFGTVLFTAINAYVLLGIAMIMGATKEQVLAGTVFYLVGALVGLFRQLAAAGAADTHSEEDYGLATARLIHTPLFSGLAGVGGVVLTLIALAITPRPATPSSTPVGNQQRAAKQEITSNEVPSLQKIFDLNNPTSVVIAAIFGLTPGLLMSRLTSSAEKFKVDLRSTEAGETAPPS